MPKLGLTVVVYVVTCGTEFMMACDQKGRVDAYMNSYNQLRPHGTPEAISQPVEIAI